VDDFPSRKGECQETSGFLFSHGCGEFATSRCEKCGKDICDRHTVHAADRVCCTTCGKEDRTPPPRSTGRRAYDPYYDYPYYYASIHYTDYHGSRDDFTDSDEAAVAGGAIAANELGVFEDDMGGS